MAQDARRLYAELGLDIEPGWHAVFLMLREEDRGLGVSHIARALGIAHPSASALVKQMTERGYLLARDDPADGRRRIVRLSAKAKRALPELDRVWSACGRSMGNVIEETGLDVLGMVTALEAALDRRAMDERTMERLKRTPQS